MRSDNAPEFSAKAVKRWLLAVSGVKPLYIEVSSPKRMLQRDVHKPLGDELLKGEMFPSLLDAKAPVEEYRNHYHRERPHSDLGYRIPAEFAAACDVDCAQQNFTKELKSMPALL